MRSHLKSSAKTGAAGMRPTRMMKSGSRHERDIEGAFRGRCRMTITAGGWAGLHHEPQSVRASRLYSR